MLLLQQTYDVHFVFTYFVKRILQTHICNYAIKHKGVFFFLVYKYVCIILW